MLAINAALRNNQNIDGGAYPDNLVQRGEIHLQKFTGTIAALLEPSACAMVLASRLPIVGFVRRKA